MNAYYHDAILYDEPKRAHAGLEAVSNEGVVRTLEGATKVYKSVGNIRLHLFIFQPVGHKKGDNRPAIVFFRPRQFEEHCKYFSSRGMVAATVEYRVMGRHGVTPFECIADAKSAIRWVRSHAEELGVDPNRIVASGGSAGGYLAASVGIIKRFDEEGEDLRVSSVPNALVLFNPLVDLSRFRDRFPRRWREASPAHNVTEGVPPTIIFHGTEDRTIPFKEVLHFAEVMKKFGNRCELVPFEGKGHGFFNYARDRQAYTETVRAADKFLASLGHLQGPPTIT